MAYRTKRQSAKGQPGSISRRLVWAVGVALVLAIGVSSLFATGFLSGSEKESTSSELAPDITLATPGGNFQLTEHRGEVLWGQDFEGTTIRDYELLALGTEIIVDREGLVAFRSSGSAGFERLRSEIERVL